MAGSANEGSVLSYELIVTSPVWTEGAQQNNAAVRPESSSAETVKH